MQNWNDEIRKQLDNLPGFPAIPNTAPPVGDRWVLGQWIDETRVRPAVADVPSLPATGNEPGDVRIVDADQSWYYWNGFAWVPMGTGGPGPILTVTGVAPINATGGPNPIVSHDPSGVAAGTYGDTINSAQIVVDAKGHVTSATEVPIAFPAAPIQSVTGTAPIAVTAGANPVVSHNASGVVAGTYGDATNVSRVTVDARGHVTAATTTPIAFPTAPIQSITGTAPISVTAGANPVVSHDNSGVVANTYGSSTAVPQVTVDARGHVTGVSNVAIAVPNGAAVTKLGNVLIVDAVNGNDLTGTVNGPPFLTIEAAIAYINTNALTGVTIWIQPGTYTLASATTGLTIPNTCSLRGMSVQTTRIVMNAVNPGGTVTMLTMGENSRVEDVTLTLNSSNATTNLVGVALPGTTSNTSKLRTAVVTVDNSGLAVGTTTNVYGILDNGTGSIGPATFSFNFTRGVTVNVFSNGGGIKRGVLVSSANDVTFRDTNFYVRAPTNPASTGDYRGVETTDPLCSVQFRTSSISGPSTAGGYTGSDIYQTSPGTGFIDKGIQLGPGCDLVNKTAGGKPFTTYVTPTTLLYCIQSNVQAATRYLWPGTLTSSGDATEVFYRFQQKAIVQGMSFNVRVAPGVGHSLTVTVRKSTTGVPGSGVATTMTQTITGAATQGTQYTTSVDFAQGEYLSVQVVGSAGITAQDLVVELDLF